MKKFIYTAAIAAATLGLVACGGKDSDSTSGDSTSSDLITSTDIDNSSLTDENDESGPSITDEAGSSENTYFTSAELDKFVSDGKSGDIDRMISALEWYNQTCQALKPDVRNLDENAIKAVADLEKADEDIADKYGALSLTGALNNMMSEMSESQKTQVSTLSAQSVLFFTAQDDTSEYDRLYRKYRYGSFF